MSSFLAFARCPPQLRNYCCWLIGGWKLVLCRRYRSLLDIFDESGASPSTTSSVLYHNMSLLQTLQTLAEIWVLKYESFFEAPFIGSSTQWLTHWVTDTLNHCLRGTQRVSQYESFFEAPTYLFIDSVTYSLSDWHFKSLSQGSSMLQTMSKNQKHQKYGGRMAG